MRKISHKICQENQNTHFMFSNFFSENRAVHEITWKNIVEPDRPQMAVGACALHAEQIRLQTHTQNIYLLLFHCNNSYANAPHFYDMRSLPVLLKNMNINCRYGDGKI
jgi:hypothetical protein